MNALARSHSMIMSACLLPLLITGGCQTAPIIPPPEAVLEGTWELVPDQQLDLTRNILVFDAFGELTELRSVFLSITITDREVHSSTSVVGQAVTITTKGELVFSGTFNADFTVATGSLSARFTIPFTSTEVSIDGGTATLTKQ